MIWVFSSILLSVQLLLTQETRFSKSCSHWKFCFKPQIPLRFPVKTENHWLCILRAQDTLHILYYEHKTHCIYYTTSCTRNCITKLNSPSATLVRAKGKPLVNFCVQLVPLFTQHIWWSLKRGGPSSGGENNANLSMCPLA